MQSEAELDWCFWKYLAFICGQDFRKMSENASLKIFITYISQPSFSNVAVTYDHGYDKLELRLWDSHNMRISLGEIIDEIMLVVRSTS